MGDSILQSTKKYLGIDTDCDSFDMDVILHINSVFAILYQIGVDSAKNARIEDPSTKWEDIFSDEEDLLRLIKDYVYLRVRVIFDPPTSSFVLEAINKQIAEYEWRIQIEAEGAFDEISEEPTKTSRHRRKKYQED